jgi:hypothetical protein
MKGGKKSSCNAQNQVHREREERLTDQSSKKYRLLSAKVSCYLSLCAEQKKSVNLSIFLRSGCQDDSEENGVLLIEKIPSVHIIVEKSNARVTIYTQSLLRVSMKQRKRIYFHRIV